MPKAKRMNKRRTGMIVLAVLVLVGFGIYLSRDGLYRRLFRPTSSTTTRGTNADAINKEVEVLKVMAQELTVPWEVVVLPDDDLLVTERSGVLRKIGKDGRSFPIEGVEHSGEGGLMGLALHPKYEENKLLYLYLTTTTDEGLTNRVEQYQLENNQLTNKKIIIENIPGARNHDGGRIAFGPDGYLYITTGDAGNDQSAQDTASLAGKILRIKDDGSIPSDNPFNNAVYSYGHRNSQGIAWDDKGNLWSSEHGRSGAATGFDEINKIEKGANYGWPLIQGDEEQQGMKKPVVHSGSEEAWAPASLAFYKGSLYFGGLRGQSLYQAIIKDDGSLELKAHLKDDYGRIRAVTVHEGLLYFTTSNTDGRGSPQTGDDKVVRIRPDVLR